MKVVYKDNYVKLYIHAKNKDYTILFGKEDIEYFLNHRIYFRSNNLMCDNNGRKEYLYKFFNFEKPPLFINNNPYDYRKSNLMIKEKKNHNVQKKL